MVTFNIPSHELKQGVLDVRSGTHVRIKERYGGDKSMPTYIVLHELSGENVEGMEADIEEGKEALEALGGELKGLYLTFGQYDAVGVIDLPDDEAAAQFVLTLSKELDVSTETLRAFSEDETKEILAGLPE